MSGPEATPLSVLIPTKNEAKNLGRCLEPLRDWADEVVVVDSQSSDGTLEIARSFGARVVQFLYEGGWPKKRQWALDNCDLRNEWVLLLDADEILLPGIKEEISKTLASPGHDGYRLRLQIHFLGRLLRFGDTRLWKLSLFRKGKGRFERRLDRQDASMLDMEIHEHVVLDGTAGRLEHPIRHENSQSLSHYIDKHNAYSTWEAHVLTRGRSGDVPPTFRGTQAQRRRWLKIKFIRMPGASMAAFLYFYVLRGGILDGVPGFLCAAFRGVQIFHTKAKMLELRNSSSPSPSGDTGGRLDSRM